MAMADHDCELTPDPDGCFRCKMRHIRAHGGLAVAYQGSRPGKARDFFHESTIPERQRRVVEGAKRNGWEARLKNPLYDNPAKFPTSDRGISQ